jgi:hypothetical protein
MDKTELVKQADKFANDHYNLESNKRKGAYLFMKDTLKKMYIDVATKHGQQREENEFKKWKSVVDAQRIQLSAQYQLPELSEVLEILDKHRHYEISDNTLLEMLRDKFTKCGAAKV